jgi:hypothetical protein
VPRCGPRANTSGSPADLATGAPPRQLAFVGTPASRSAADAADSARPERTVSYSTGICVDLGVSLAAIFGPTPIPAKPTSANPKNAPGGKKIHQPRSRYFYLKSGSKSTAPPITFIPPEEDSFHSAALR